MFTKDDVTCALVKFPCLSHCDKVHSYFNDPFKKIHKPLRNKMNNIVEFLYAYDTSDLKDSQWYAVVFRNLPHDFTKKQIEQQCRQIIDTIKYSTTPKKVCDSLCAVVVVKDLDSAEKLCLYYNKKSRDNLKVEILFNNL